MNINTDPLATSGESVPATVAAPVGGDPGEAIGALLIRFGKLKASDLDRVLKLQKEKNLRFGEAAIQLKLVGDKDIERALAHQYQYPYSLDSKGMHPKLVAAMRPFDPDADGLRTARAQLLLGWFAEGRKMLAIGAPTEKEESGVLAANLAVLFAQLGKKVLLIDANLRKPGLHALFKLNNASGLSELLAGRVAHFAATTVQPFQTLSLLSAGSVPPNPSELLLRAPLDFLFEEAAQNYDIVLIDTAPARVSSDYQIVAARAGGMLLAVREGQTRLDAVADMKAKILAAGSNVVGAVMTA